MSDATIQAIVGGIVSVALAYLTYLGIRIKVVLDKTHGLVNSQMGIQLKLHAVAARRIASNGNPADVTAAVEAEKLLAEHEANQAKVDAGEK